MMNVKMYSDKQMDQICDFIAETFGDGDVGTVGHEINSKYVHTDVAAVTTPEGDRCFATFGMGARAMNAPIVELERVELVMFASGDVETTSREAAVIMGELQGLSKFPFKNDTFFGPGHTVGASDTFSKTFGFDAFVLVPLEEMAFAAGESVLFLGAIPIYQQERKAMMEGDVSQVMAALAQTFGNALFFVDSGRNMAAV